MVIITLKHFIILVRVVICSQKSYLNTNSKIRYKIRYFILLLFINFSFFQRNAAIKTLLLRHNKFEDKGAEWFNGVLNENVSLETLDLSWNCFQSRGCIMLCEAIKVSYTNGYKYHWKMIKIRIGKEICHKINRTYTCIQKVIAIIQNFFKD